MALADKFDSLAVSGPSMKSRPVRKTRSPAPRRLGIIRILLETETRLALTPILAAAFDLYKCKKPPLMICSALLPTA